ncbi:hypothetical protein Acr_17g0008940 [Actinidia rufa]|uniref:RNase H type-1 domain-containing protein n=1 Tax=Actinidia rufa TaxID=165716 RepID=A0A7J0G3H8_9ERIC|nr:hypothetical protein Acr_17g0008940 [Actinidia rufa]
MTGDRNGRVPSDSSHAQMEMSTADGKLPATPQRHGRVNHSLTDTTGVEPRAELRQGICKSVAQEVKVVHAVTFAKLFLMVSHSSNRSTSHETRRETPYALKTPWRKGGKTRAKKDKAKTNPRVDRGGDDEADPMADEEEDLPLGHIHMIGGPHYPNLKNRIRGEIRMFKQMHEVLSVQSPAKKSRVIAVEPMSLMFTKADLEKLARAPLVGFNAQSHWPLRVVTFKVQDGSQELMIEFVVVDIPSPYNTIAGRDWLHKMKGMASTLHQAAMKEVQLVEEEQEVLEDVGRNLEAKVVEDFVFAWTPYEMHKINLNFIRHELNVLPDARLVKQKGRRSATEHVDVVIKEAEKIKEVDWGSRMNNGDPLGENDTGLSVYYYFATRILAVRNSLLGANHHARMSFLDAYRGYQQISMHEPNQEKTAFITARSVFCYKVMPFGLKNIGATYQSMITKNIQDDTYIDDMVVKSKEDPDHIRDLTEVEILGAPSDEAGIEANPKQITAINNVVNPRTAKEVQKLTGMAATLNRFIKQCCLVSTYSKEEDSTVGPFENQPALGDPEVTQDLPQVLETTSTGRAIEGPESRGRNSFEKPRGINIEQCHRLDFLATNNKAEYEAFIAGLRSSSKLKVLELHIFSDSKLVVNQVTEKFEGRGHKMAKYLIVAKSLFTEFRAVNIEQVGRDLNSHVDALANLASIFGWEAGRTIVVKVISAPSLETQQKSVLTNWPKLDGPNR